MTTLNNALLTRRSFKNFKPSNTRKTRKGLANVRNGLANMNVAIVGDSTQAGDGAGTGTNGYDGARVLSASRKLATMLAPTTGKGIIAAQETAIFGSAGVASGTPGQYLTYDTRVLMPSGWSLASAGIGGGYYDNSTTTNALSFTPTIAFDTIVYWYAQNTGLATFTVDIDGGAAIETPNSAGSGALVKHTLTVALGTHTINWKRTGVGANLRILGCTVYNSASKTVDVWNMGVAGSLSTSWINAANPWSPLNALTSIAADLYVIDLGINDWINGTDPTTFQTNMQTIITACAAQGDVVLCSPVPRAIASTPLATQLLYVTALQALQVSNDLPWVDFRNLFETQEIANTNGMMYDVTHPNNNGYAEKARLMSAIFDQALAA
jgi:hypothetical protein